MSRTRSVISCTRSAGSGEGEPHCRCEEPPGRRFSPPEDRLRDEAIPLQSSAPVGRLLRFARNDGLVEMKVGIDYAICNSCGLCREVCPESAIRPKLLEPRHLYEVQPEKCTGCGECLDYCPAPGALVQYAEASA